MEIIGNTFFFDWEVSLMVWIQQHFGAVGGKLAVFFTEFGEPLILILVGGLIYWSIDKKFGKYLMANVFAVSLFCPMIKNIARRRRPYMDNEAIQCIRPAEKGDINDVPLQGFSFPSIHAANTIVLYTRIGQYLKSKTLKIICLVLPFLIGLSRVVLGVHYPTDVLCGWLIGALLMLLVDFMIKKTDDIKKVILILLIIAFPGFFFCKSTDFYTAYGLTLGMLLATVFEEKKVNFKPAKNKLFALLRVVAGGVIFLALSSLLKLPFPKELLSSATTAAFLIRMLRYAVISFILFGIYPICFNKGKLDL